MLGFIAFSPAYAGWYKVNNYEGHIGKQPVMMSLQFYDSFGGGITVEGNYYYKKHKSPIPIYGRNLSGEELELYEIHGGKAFDDVIKRGSKEFAKSNDGMMVLKISERGAQGIWKNKGNSYEVDLVKTNTLDDTDHAVKGVTQYPMEIPFWVQTREHLIVGVYEDPAQCNIPFMRQFAHMHKLKIISKESGKVIQEINFDKDGCTAGNYMTPIYMNVENRMDESNDFIINYRGDRQGPIEIYAFDNKTQKYIVIDRKD